jgi:hypothetical protein
MLKEDEYIDLQAPFESHRLHERMSDIEDGWQSYTRGRGGEYMGFIIYGINVHFMRSLEDRYEVIYDWPSPVATIARADVAKEETMITDVLALENRSQGIWRARVIAHFNVWWVWPVAGTLTS